MFREQAGGRGFVNYDLVNSRGGEVSDDFEGDEEISFDGSQTPTQSRRGFCNFEAVRSPPQLPPLPEETTSQGFEGSFKFFLHSENLDRLLDCGNVVQRSYCNMMSCVCRE